MRHVSYSSAVEAVGYGRFQRRLLWICGLGWAADAMEIMLISFALPAMSADWSLSAAQKAGLGSAVFIGMLAGALFWGRLSDKIGRKTCFVATMAVDSIFGLLSAFAPSFQVFLVFRILTGFGVGGTLPVDYGMFAEFLPAENRGRRLVLLESFWAFGTTLAALLAWMIVPRLGWRPLFALSALPGLLLFLVRTQVPESPRYLLSEGRVDEAYAVLSRVAAVNGTSAPETPHAETPSAEKLAAPVQSRTIDLFSPRLLRTTVLLWSIWFLISVGYYGAFTWLPSWLRSKGFPLPSVYPYSFLMAIAQLPGYFSAAYLVERWGRRRTLGVYLAASGVCSLLFAFASAPASVIAAAAALSFFGLGAWGALYAYTPEAYPTAIRTTGIGVASGMGRIAGLVAPSIGALAAVGSVGTGAAQGAANPLLLPLAVFAVAYAVAGAAALALPFETMGEELEDALPGA